MRQHSEFCGRGVCWCDDLYWKVLCVVIGIEVLLVIAAVVLVLVY